MTDPGKQTSRSIDTQREALAEAAVARQYQLQPELRLRYGETGQAKCVADTLYHLDYLASALASSSPALFTEYIAWMKLVLTSRNIRLDDLAGNLQCLRGAIEAGLPQPLAALADDLLQAGMVKLFEASTDPLPFLDGEDALTRLAKQYLDNLLSGERHDACSLLLDAVRDGLAIRDLYLRVLQPCQREIGRLWQLNRITVAQEHFCSAATQLVMSQVYPLLFAKPAKGRRLVSASVPGELHEIGLRIVTDLLEQDGWDTTYLGANLPLGSVVQTVADREADALLISVTMAFYLSAVEELIGLLRSSNIGQQPKVIVGGYPFNVDPELWRKVGADGYAADAGDVSDTLCRLLSIEKPAAPLQRATGVQVSGQSGDPVAVGKPRPGREVAGHDELTRLNNDLLTLQRELAKKNAELLRANGQIHSLLESTTEGICGIDTDGRLTFLNRAAATLLGFTATEVEGQVFHDLIHQPDVPISSAQDCTVCGAFQQGRATLAANAFFRRQDGSSFPVEYSCGPIREVESIRGVVVVFRDITEQKRLESQARHAQKMASIGRLAGGVAHALNNLMTTALGQSEILLAGMKHDEPLRASVLAIQRAASRTAALTQKLLLFSGKRMLTLLPVDLNAVVSRLEKAIRNRHPGIEVDLSLEPGLARTRTDPQQLEESILALVRNADEAMPGGGKLTLRTATVELGAEYVQAHPELGPGLYVLLAVSDTGIGMSQEAVGHLFEPFFSSKEAVVGSGLELAMVYGFVKQCGGDIDVRSEPGKGTTFHLYLPRASEASAESNPPG